MPQSTRRRARTTVAAAMLMLAVSAYFLTTGIEYVRLALDTSAIDPQRRLVMTGLGMNPEEAANFVKFFAILVLGLCTLAIVLALGVLRRKENMRYGAIALFGLLTIIWLPLTIGSVLSDNPPPDARLQLLAALVDAVIVYLLFKRETAEDFEDVEVDRRRARIERDERRRAQRAGKKSPERSTESSRS